MTRPRLHARVRLWLPVVGATVLAVAACSFSDFSGKDLDARLEEFLVAPSGLTLVEPDEGALAADILEEIDGPGAELQGAFRDFVDDAGIPLGRLIVVVFDSAFLDESDLREGLFDGDGPQPEEIEIGTISALLWTDEEGVSVAWAGDDYQVNITSDSEESAIELAGLYANAVRDAL